MSHYKAGRWSEALKSLQAASEDPKTKSEVFEAMADCAEHLNKDRDAYAYYYRAGLLHADKAEFDKALACYSKCGSYRWDALQEQAEIYKKRGEQSLAANFFKRASDLRVFSTIKPRFAMRGPELNLQLKDGMLSEPKLNFQAPLSGDWVFEGSSLKRQVGSGRLLLYTVPVKGTIQEQAGEVFDALYPTWVRQAEPVALDTERLTARYESIQNGQPLQIAAFLARHGDTTLVGVWSTEDQGGALDWFDGLVSGLVWSQ
jgi:tetratricopeptide (TPR) repeat protein